MLIAQHKFILSSLMRILLTLLLVSSSYLTHAALCPSDFGVYSRGQLRIGNGVSINSNSVPRTTSGNLDGINPDTGAVEDQNPLFTLPALNPSSFPPNSSTNDTSFFLVFAGSYDDVIVNDNSTTFFTGGTYNINTLNVGDNANMVLVPGTYYIDTFTMGDGASLTIFPSGQVDIFINGSADFGQDVEINAGGIVSNLTFYHYNNADLTTADNTSFVGTIYSPFNSTDVEFGDDSTITGGIFTNGRTELGDDITLTYGAAEQARALAIMPCSSGLHHIEIRHDGTGLTCEPEFITVRACANSDCSSLYTTDVNVTLTPTGWSGGDTQSIINGSSTFQYRNTTASTITYGVSSSAPSASNALVCLNTATSSNSCAQTFYDTGFIYTIPTQTSCATSPAITISAVRLDNTSQACVPTFNGQTRDVVFSLAYATPSTGSSSLSLNYNGTDYTPINGTTSQTVPINFDTNGQATFTTTYPDAGQITLNSLYTGSSGTGDAGLSMSGATTFTTIPYKLYVFADETDFDCAGSLPTCSAFKRAGDAFNLKVRGACSDDSVTPNFQLDNLTLTHINTAPAINQGTLGTSVFNVIAGENGEHTISQTVSEVGAFTFTAAVPVSGYFGETIGTAALNTSSEIGRFYPGHFCLSANTILNRTDTDTASSCTDNFSYLDEEFDAQYTLTAQAFGAICTDASLTENYTSSWSKFVTPFIDDTSNANEIGKWNLAAVNDPSGTATNLNSRLVINTTDSSPAEFTTGQAIITAKINIDRAGSAPSYTAETAFTDVHIGINPIDTDSVAIDSTDLTIGTDTYRDIGNTDLFFGRLFSENAFGTNQADVGLDMYARTEYCTAVSSGTCTNWQHKTDDSCSLYNINPPAGVSLGTGISPTPIGTPGYYLRASPTVSSSTFTFNDDGTTPSYARIHVPDTNDNSAGWRLFYTAGGNGGNFTIPFQFPFNTDTTVHPYLLHVDGVASFGQFRGDDRIIFWREVLE